jgi:drug/metabolite transporter (DMT)-like permease
VSGVVLSEQMSYRPVNRAIVPVTATAAGLILTLIPLFGAAALVALLHESLGAPQVAGGAFVIAAAALAARAPT